VKEKVIKVLSPDNNIIQDINVSGNDVTIVTTTPMGSIESKAAIGEESTQSAVDGSPLKVVIKNKSYVVVAVGDPRSDLDLDLRVPLYEQELFTLPEHRSSCCSIFIVFCVVF